VRLVDGDLVYAKPAIRPIRARRWRVLAVATAVVDLVAIVAALALATLLSSTEPAGVSMSTSWQGAAIPWLAGLAAVGLYDIRRFENPVEELRRILYGVTLGWAIVIVGSFWSAGVVSRGWAIAAWILVLVGVTAGRRIVRKAVHALRRRGRLRRAALIVGADPSGSALAQDVASAPWEGLDVIGFVAGPHQASDVPPASSIPVVGSTGDLRTLAVSMAVSDVLVAPSVAGNGGMAEIVSQLDGVPVELRVAPGLDGFLTSRLNVQPLGARALVAIERVELRPLARAVKRCLDIGLGSVALALATPIIFLAAVAVQVESPGPAFFSQIRVGLRGRRFQMWKLRTMRDGAERQQDALERSNEADGVLFKMREDPRVTRVGRVLRRTSIDELPQLLNVILGHMSLVGPRPPLPAEVERYDESLGRRLLVRPGLTGLWQVSGRNELSFEDYVRFDLLYVQNWSIALDLYVLAKTVPAVITGRGAY
jgi:exopolysaccharide biosynthesis polyprenyl glycosylphosphotransferase